MSSALFAVLLVAFAFASTQASREVDYFGTPGPVVDVDATKLPKSTHVDTLHPTCRGANVLENDPWAVITRDVEWLCCLHEQWSIDHNCYTGFANRLCECADCPIVVSEGVVAGLVILTFADLVALMGGIVFMMGGKD